ARPGRGAGEAGRRGQGGAPTAHGGQADGGHTRPEVGVCRHATNIQGAAVLDAAAPGVLASYPRLATGANCSIPFAPGRSSGRHGACQNVSARHEAGPLEGLAAGDVLRITPRGRNTPAFVADALQFLNEVRADAAPAERLAHRHVDVTVGAVVMEQDVPGRG